MAEAPYWIALALVEKAGVRAMPLNGKSLGEAAAAGDDPGSVGQMLALELLLRLWQCTDGEPLRRAAADLSLLLVELPLEVMTERLPPLKAAWVASGDTDAFLEGLALLAQRAWRLSIAKYEPLRFTPWP